MRVHDQVLTEEDFEQLPAALQRKYFSSLERLRLAQVAHGSSSSTKLRFLSAKRPSTSHLARSLSLRKNSLSSAGSTDRNFSVATFPPTRSGTRLRKASRQPISPLTTLVNPWEFAALPAAIQRKHFSPEERYHLASRLNLTILDAADEALYKQCQPRSRSTTLESLDTYEDAAADDYIPLEVEGEDEMDPKDLESFRWLDNDTDLDLRLDDYHAISTDLVHSTPVSPRRRSFRRGLSFSNVSFRRRSSSSTSLQSPVPAGSFGHPTIVPGLLPPRHQSKASTISLDPSTTHYQDPAAKMKLRVYLASPQKFDEAIEFGFPSLQKDGRAGDGRPKTSPGGVNGQAKTFFADDTPSLSDDESRDGKSDHFHQDSPQTPIDVSFPVARAPQKTSTERSNHLRPRIVHQIGESHAHAGPSDREMTLKMTLTRPELRVLEETDHLKPLVNETPIERPPLTVPVEGSHSIWDELPEEPSRVKRFFKKLKGRG